MKERTKSELYSWLKSLALAFVIAFICRQFIFSPTMVHGESMSPTFEDSDRLIITKHTDIQRFDIIVFDAPDAEDTQYIKRVIGLPGDHIEMKDDVLYINGEALAEPYLDENKKQSLANQLTEDFSLQDKTGKFKVPSDQLFVLGDNRLISKDSRIFGFISADSVIGEVKFRFYPLDEIGMPD